MLSLPAPTQVMHMVLFDRGEEYRRYMDHYFPKLPQRRALFIQQRARACSLRIAMAIWRPICDTNRYNAMLNERDCAMPLWLDEGLAEYFEVPSGDRWSGHPHLRWLKSLSPDYVPDLVQLEELCDVGQMESEHYRDAWAWVHFLMHRRQSTRALLSNQLAAFRNRSIVPPLSRELAGQLPAVRSEFLAHFRAL